jgi:hypothetical protein
MAWGHFSAFAGLRQAREQKAWLLLAKSLPVTAADAFVLEVGHG